MMDGQLCPSVEITMLGQFSISIGGNRSTDGKGRSKRVFLLLQYLVSTREKEVSADMLTEALWEEEECGNPLNALKNLVYRARKYLKQLSGGSDFEFIRFAGNTYHWNNDCDCKIDTEQLVSRWKTVNDTTLPNEERIRACEAAVKLYRGEFLPQASEKNWVISMSVWFDTIYRECVLQGCSLLAAGEQFERIIPICRLALQHAPYDENIHKMMIYAYVSLGRPREALDHYNRIAAMFSKELDVDVTASFSSVYLQIMNGIHHKNVRMGNIRQDLREASQTKGAYFCDYDVFRSICQVQIRARSRDTSSCCCIILLTLEQEKEDLPKPAGLRVAMSRLREAILSCLRAGDVFASYSASQYIILLVFSRCGSEKAVIDRITQKFHSLYGRNNARLASQTDTLDAVK